MLETRKLKENRSDISDEEAEKSLNISQFLYFTVKYLCPSLSNVVINPAAAQTDQNIIILMKIMVLQTELLSYIIESGVTGAGVTAEEEEMKKKKTEDSSRMWLCEEEEEEEEEGENSAEVEDDVMIVQISV